ncbi:hypothetical protein VNO77_01699 [Canavalia gladiata]|uniref:Uncharacterized protein n=1 Tax=Canavalia gladiata TaxID=3824 RepID=A0AAN9R6J3_CANGL
MSMGGRSDMKMNAIRSGIVVLGAIAFGYLSFQIGFKPFLEKAQQQNELYQSQSQSQSQSHSDSDSDPSSPSHQSSFAFPETRS